MINRYEQAGEPLQNVPQPHEQDVQAVAAAVGDRRVALVQEWLSWPLAGSEKVFLATANLFSSVETSVYTLFDQRPQQVRDIFGARTSFLQAKMLQNRAGGLSVALMPLAWRQVARDCEEDIAVISTHLMANRFARYTPNSLAYCHSPVRYAWAPEADQRAPNNLVGRSGTSLLRKTDRRAADQLGALIANSQCVAERIKTSYNRQATVVHPPVDTLYFTPDPTIVRDIDILCVGRMVAYKRFDIAIECAAQLGVKCTIAGNGPLAGQLKEMANTLGADVSFFMNPTNAQIRELYRRTRLLINLAHEDFGIVSAEAIACGTPVLALDRGGACEIVANHVGVRASEPSVRCTTDLARQALDEHYEPELLASHASAFDYSNFYQKMTTAIVQIAPQWS